MSSLLLLYGLHPLDLEARVQQALEKVRPLLRSHGGNVELLGIADGVVRLRMLGSCHGCPSSAMTLKNAIEEAIYAAAPDATAIEVEGVAEPPPPGGIVQIAPLGAALAPEAHPFPVEGLTMQDATAATRHPLSTLRRLVPPRQSSPAQRCELCGLALAAEHAHLVEPASRRLLCSCEPCAILFSGADRRAIAACRAAARSLPTFS